MVDLTWTMPHSNFIISCFRIGIIGGSVETFIYYTSQVKLHYNYTLKNLIPGGQYDIYILRCSSMHVHVGPRFRLREFL